MSRTVDVATPHQLERAIRVLWLAHEFDTAVIAAIVGRDEASVAAVIAKRESDVARPDLVRPRPAL